MLTRNRELARLVLVYLVVSGALAAIALALDGASAALWVVACACSLGIVFAVFTWGRYRDIAHISNRVDAVLHGERRLSLDRMREGELAVLSSELEKMVSRLNLTADELERETVALADSLANISHQIKTPLTSLSIMCELLRKRVIEADGDLSRLDSGDMLSRLRTMQMLQERVQWLVSVLLKMARIDAGVVKLASMPVDAAQLVGSARDALAIAFDVAGVRLSVDVQEGASFMGDPSWSAEALENVMKNCMEHAGEGGEVRVRVTQDSLACRIRIEDSGPGISEEDLPHIFERFYRGSDAQTAPSSPVDPAGVGIGLALAHSLVSAQGGAIKASNVRDAEGNVLGARFDLVFFSLVV